MAKPLQPVLSQSTGGSLPIQAPPVDTSTADVLGLVGNMAIEGYRGYQRAQVADAYINDIEDFLAADKAKGEGSAAMAAAGMVLDKEGPESAAYNNAKADLERIATIINRGAGNTAELKMRVQSKLRQYINQMPGYAQELRATASGILGDYSTELDAIQSREAAAGKEDELFMSLLKREDNGHIAAQLSAGLINKEQAKTELVRNEVYMDNFRKLDQLNKMGNVQAEILAKEPVFDQGLEATRMAVSGKISSILDNSKFDQKQKTALIKAEISKTLTSLAPYRNSDVGRQKVAALEKALTDVATNAEEVISGRQSKDFLTTRVSIIEAQAKAGLYETETNLPEYKAFVEALGPSAQSLNINTALIPEHMRLWKKITTEKNPFLNSGLDAKGKKDFFNMAGEATRKVIDSKDKEGVKSTVVWFADAGHALTSSKGTTEADFNGYVQQLADEKIGLAIYNEADAKQRSDILTPVENYLTNVMQAGVKNFNKRTMTLVETEDGRLLVRASPNARVQDSRMVDELNRKVMPRLNNSIRAIAHMQKGSNNYQSVSNQVNSWIMENASDEIKTGWWD